MDGGPCVVKFLLGFLIILITYGLLRLLKRRKFAVKRHTCKTMICLGSGGHTTEMLSLIKNLDFMKYTPRCYVIANTDTVSLEKLRLLEKSNIGNEQVIISYIPRSRQVNQSYLSSVITTLRSILYCIPIVWRFKPELILCNGPGTCIPICFIAFILNQILLLDTKLVFVESFCRTKTLSLSGKLLLYIVDHFIVQWPTLAAKSRRIKYLGQLM